MHAYLISNMKQVNFLSSNAQYAYLLAAISVLAQQTVAFIKPVENQCRQVIPAQKIFKYHIFY